MTSNRKPPEKTPPLQTPAHRVPVNWISTVVTPLMVAAIIAGGGYILSDLNGDIAGVRAEIDEVRAEIDEVRSGVKADIAELRSEVRSDIAELRADVRLILVKLDGIETVKSDFRIIRNTLLEQGIILATD